MNQASQYSSAWKTKSTLFHRKINHIWFFQSPCVGCRYLKAVPFMFNWGYWGSDAHLTRPIYATLHRARYVARKGVHEMGQKSRTTLRARIGGLKIALSVQNTKPKNTPQVRFPLSAGAGLERDGYLAVVWSIVHWHNIQHVAHIHRQTYIGWFGNPLPTNNPTLETFLYHLRTHCKTTEIKLERENRKKERER